MAFLLDTNGHSRSRNVSPEGTSRFEGPLVRQDLVISSPKPASPTSPTSDRKSIPHRTQASLASTDLTTTTAPTSIQTHDLGSSHDAGYTFLDSPSPVTAQSRNFDAWFEQFHSNEDVSLEAGDECPDRATLAAVQNIPLYDSNSELHTFGSLFDPSTSTHQRQLFVFVRHFYCGACQAYLQALTKGISQRDYFRIPIPTAIIVIGCGQPDLIPQYKKFTGCPWPMYADPTRAVFKKLGMNVTLKIGRQRPEYMKDISAAAWLQGQAKTISKSLRDPDGIRKRDIFRGGNPMQIGGEFLVDQGEVVWCHRMRHYRNHAEVAVVRKVLELDDEDGNSF